jgi:hypothetical protein
MTEAEWLGWNGDPCSLLDSVRDRVSERKLRLFACACCWRIAHLLSDERSHRAVQIGERFADGQVDKEALTTAKVSAHAAHFAAATEAIFCPEANAAACAFYTVTFPAIYTFAAANRATACVGPKKEAEQQEQCRLFRDLLGNPFRPAPSLAPSILSWDGGTGPKLATAIYDECAFGRLPVLADALEDAGCTDAAILGHCRDPGPHARGCWVVDLLLGKA